MVGKRTTENFERDGVEDVRRQVENNVYDERKKQMAIQWLNQQDPQWQRDRDIKALRLARRTARDTRLGLVLLGLILVISVAQLVWQFLD